MLVGKFDTFGKSKSGKKLDKIKLVMTTTGKILITNTNKLVITNKGE